MNGVWNKVGNKKTCRENNCCVLRRIEPVLDVSILWFNETQKQNWNMLTT